MGITLWLRPQPASAKASPTSFRLSNKQWRPRVKLLSRGTIALQERLIDKDIPPYRNVSPASMRCRQRPAELPIAADSHEPSKAPTPSSNATTIAKRCTTSLTGHKTSDGDKTDLGYDPPWEVWRTVVSDAGNCLGRKCPHYNRCFFIMRGEKLKKRTS